MNIHGLDLVCSDGAATLLGFLDPSIAPAFLYYSYIPIIFVSLIFALVILVGTKGKPAGRILYWASVIFSLSLIGEILLWISTPVLLIHFVWEIMAIFHILIVTLIGYFVYVFVKDTDLSVWWKWLWVLLIAPIMLLIPTTLNLTGFDLEYCESVQGPLWTYIYLVEGIITLAVLAFSINSARKTSSSIERNKILSLGIGATLFLIIYIASYALGDYLLTYNTNLLGPVGMVVFLISLTYLIVKYHAFNLRIVGAQALVTGVVILLFSALFVRSIDNVRYVLIGTLVLVIILGALLIRGVLREVKQRERLELLTRELGTANDRLKEVDHLKSEFLSIASHQLRAPITAVRGYAANINQGEYGPVPEHLKVPLETVQESARLMASSIEDYLNISRIEQGRMKYEKSTFDIADLAKKVVAEMTPVASKKGLTLVADIPEDLNITGDVGKIKQVLANLIDNAIKYTQKGSVSVNVSKAENKARIAITDSGVGIAPDEIGGLFEKFKRARGANKVNTTGTGLGLYVAKQLTEGNGGTVRAESAGSGLGSTFIVEFPL